MRIVIVGAMLSALLALHAAPPPRKPPMKKGDLSKEFKRVADPPKKNNFEKPQKNYDPPKPKGPGSSGPKPPSPK